MIDVSMAVVTFLMSLAIPAAQLRLGRFLMRIPVPVNGQFVLPVGGQMLSSLAAGWISPTAAR